MKILFLNHSEKNCGVYQYGKRVAKILSEDLRYNIIYEELDSELEFYEKVDYHKPNIILYNWHHLTMNWLTERITRNFFTVKQLFFYHEAYFPSNFKTDGILKIDFSGNEDNKTFNLPRPLFEFNEKKVKNEIITFGSFGFGFLNKGFDKICSIINKNFDQAIINLQIPNSFYGDRNGNYQSLVINNCEKMITKPYIKLNINTEFLSEENLLSFLNNNDCNIFLYDNMPGRGISSCTDYALSVDTPLIINNSNMFRHILSEKPNISIDNNSIDGILSLGTEPINHFKEKWSQSNLKDAFYKILEKI